MARGFSQATPARTNARDRAGKIARRNRRVALIPVTSARIALALPAGVMAVSPPQKRIGSRAPRLTHLDVDRPRFGHSGTHRPDRSCPTLPSQLCTKEKSGLLLLLPGSAPRPRVSWRHQPLASDHPSRESWLQNQGLERTTLFADFRRKGRGCCCSDSGF